MPVLPLRRRWLRSRACIVGQRRARPGDIGVLPPLPSRDRRTPGTAGTGAAFGSRLGVFKGGWAAAGSRSRPKTRCLQGGCVARPGSFSPWGRGDPARPPPAPPLEKALSGAGAAREYCQRHPPFCRARKKKKKIKNCISEERA